MKSLSCLDHLLSGGAAAVLFFIHHHGSKSAPNSQFTIPICSATPSLIHQELALADGLNGSE